MEIEYMNIDKLIPYINNPRNNERAVDMVAGSINEFGFKNPIIVDRELVIINGHTRLLAARKLGLAEVPVIKTEDLTDKQVKAFRIADNKVAEFSEWDYDMLKVEIEGIDIDMEQFGIIMTSHDEIDIDKFFEDAGEPKEKEPKEIKCPHCEMYFEAE